MRQTPGSDTDRIAAEGDESNAEDRTRGQLHQLKPRDVVPESQVSDRVIEVFINAEGEFRSGWRVLIFAGCSLIIALLVNALIQSILALLAPHLNAVLYARANQSTPQGPGWHGVAQFDFGSIVNFLCAAVASAVCARLLERRGFESIGYQPHRGYLRDLAIGLVGGGLALSATVGVEALAACVSLTARHNGASVDILGLCTLFVGFGFAAGVEELLFRGFAFQALVHNVGPAIALAVTSLLFGVAHLMNPEASAISTINTVLAGLWLGTAYLKTRSLWFCTGLHLSWNFVMVYVFGLPVSGLKDFDHLSLLIGSSYPPVWVSGGSYGPEGGVVSALILGLSILMIWKTKLLSTTVEMAQSSRHGKPRPRYLSLSLNDGKVAHD